MFDTSKKQIPGFLLFVLIALLPFQDGCGTIVGNPKKPPNNESEDPSFFKIPVIDFTIPDSAIEDDSDIGGLALQADDLENGGQKTILVAWSKRFDRSLKEINRLSERINKIIDNENSLVVDGILTFKGKGQGQVGATIHKLTGDDIYTYEALLCHGTTPISHIRWSDDKSKVAVTRDFAPLVEDYEEPLQLLTSLTLETSDVLTIEMRAFGEASGDLPDEPAKGFIERGVMTKDADAVITVKTVSDFFNQPVPETFGGSSYLTGRMIPDPTTGGKPYSQEFVGYYKSYSFCNNGFDEDSSNLWDPAFRGPRFCIGRPAGMKRFRTFKDLVSTVKSLESVGILKSKTLAPVAIETSLRCP
jgi:hypothetical protein